MSDKEIDRELEMERIELERTKIRSDFWSKVIVSAAAVVVAAAISTFGTVYVTYLQNRGTDQMARLETQVEILRSFQEQALSADIAQRVRFAHFFSKLAPSEDDRALWDAYYADLVATYRDLIEQSLDQQANMPSPSWDTPQPTLNITGTGNAVGILTQPRPVPFDQLPDSMFQTGCLDPTTGTPGRLCP